MVLWGEYGWVGTDGWNEPEMMMREVWKYGFHDKWDGQMILGLCKTADNVTVQFMTVPPMADIGLEEYLGCFDRMTDSEGLGVWHTPAGVICDCRYTEPGKKWFLGCSAAWWQKYNVRPKTGEMKPVMEVKSKRPKLAKFGLALLALGILGVVVESLVRISRLLWAGFSAS